MELAHRGLRAPAQGIEDNRSHYPVDPDTGLGIFRSGRPVGPDDVRAVLDETPE